MTLTVTRGVKLNCAGVLVIDDDTNGRQTVTIECHKQKNHSGDHHCTLRSKEFVSDHYWPNEAER